MERTNEAVWSDKYSRWTIKVQRDGERKAFYSSKPGRKGKLEAERKADDWITEGQLNNTMRFGELADLYLESIDTGNGTAHKTKQASIIRTWLLPTWEHRKVSSLTNRDYQIAVNAPAEAKPPRSKRTCGHVRTTITAIYNYAVSDRIVMEAPLKTKIPKAATVGERQILQPQDIQRLFSPELDKYYYVNVFRFIVITGLRRGELCALEKKDLKGNKLTISGAVNSLGEKTFGKNENARRTFILPDIAMQIIAKQAALCEKEGISSNFLFPNTNGKQLNPNTLYRRWDYFCKHENFAHTSLHELRHTMISILKNQLPAPLLKQIVGHSEDMDTFGVYGHEVDGETSESAKIINSTFNNIILLG